MCAGVLLAAALLAGLDTPPPRAASSDAPDAWPALLGSGLITLQDAATLPRGRFTLLLTIDNRDRDPLGLDLVDGAVAINVGVTSWAELYGHHVFSRSVAVPDTPVLPPPPLDLILAPGAPLPRRPYYSLYSPVPYVDDSGPERFGSDIPGEVLLGMKARALAQRGKRPALAGSLEVQLPLNKQLRYLKAGSGTGGVDVRFGSSAEWQHARWSFVASMGFTRVGLPAYPDRRIEWRDGVAVATTEPLVLPHRLDAGVGLRRTLLRSLALAGELTTVFETGHRTRSLDRARPIDWLGGLQYRWKGVRMMAALRHHGNALRSMKIEPAPLAGYVDVTRVNIDDLAGYLDRMGLADAAPLLRPGTSRLLIPPPGAPPPPPGARVIPDSYRIRSEHQYGFVLLFGLHF